MTIVGEAFVSIRPDDSKFASELKSMVNAGLAGVAPELQVGVDLNDESARAELASLDNQQVVIEGEVDVDADPLLADIKQIQKEATVAAERIERIQKAGQLAVKAGTALTLGLTAPLLLAGRAAINTAGDIEVALSQTIGLAGGTKEQVQQAQEVIRSLSAETGQSLTSLSDALLGIFSAGFTGQAAFDLLDSSAHAAAAGLGEARDVANAVTNAISSYGADVLTAAAATDILVNVVKEGKAEAADIAPQFGRLLPIASELGVSFNDVGGALAFLTRKSGDASQSATQVAGVLGKLLKPTQKGAEALLAAGFSTDSLRAALKDKGLLQTLVDIRTGLENTGSSLQVVFEDVEGLNGVLGLTAGQGQAAKEVFDNLAVSGGTLDAAFAAFDETDSAKLAKAGANFQIAMADFGRVALPVLADVLGFAGDIAGKFDELPEPLQKAATAALGVSAALGPTLIIAGKIAQSFGTLQPLFAKIGRGLDAAFSGSALTKALKIGGGLAVLGAGIEVIQSQIAEAEGETEEFLGGLVDDVNATVADGDFEALSAELAELNDVRNELAEDADNALDPFKKRQLNDAVVGIDSITLAAGRLRTQASDLSAELGIGLDQALELARGGQTAVDAFKNVRLTTGIDVDPLVAANEALETLTLNFLRGKDTEAEFAAVSALTNIPVEDLHDNLAELGEQAAQLGQQFTSGLGGISDAFNATFGDEAKDTVDSFLDNFAKQTANTVAFTANIQKLIARGALDLAQSFATAGISTADLAAEAAAASDAALADFETRLDFIQVAEDTAFSRQEAFATRLTDGTVAIVEGAAAAGEDLGPRLAAALALGDDAFFAELDLIAEEARRRSLANGEGIGTGLTTGFAKGITDGSIGVQAAALQMANQTEQTLKVRFGIQSPAKMTQLMGAELAEGLAVGMEDNLRAPDLSAFTTALPTATDAAQRALVAGPVFGAQPAGAPVAAGAGVTVQTGDIIVPSVTTAREQADLVARSLVFRMQGVLG